MPGPHVLVVEDEPPIRRFIRSALGAQGFAVAEASTAREAIASATTRVPDAILMDLGLPDRDGIEVIQELRGWFRGPVIVLTARGREDDKVTGLDAGADDYLTKPFGTAELVARLRAVLRRRAPTDPTGDPVLRCGALSLDRARHRFQVGENEVHLTPVEFRLMTVLLVHQHQLVTHNQLLAEVWGPGGTEHGQYLRVYIHQLRRKIEDDPSRPKRLQTEVGVGYRLTDT